MASKKIINVTKYYGIIYPILKYELYKRKYKHIKKKKILYKFYLVLDAIISVI